MDADALTPCVARPSAAMILIVEYIWKISSIYAFSEFEKI